MDIPKLLNGGTYEDERGRLFFNNNADLSQIKRLYFVEHPNKEIFRAWQAHKQEQKWFQVVKGRFELNLIRVNWLVPKDLTVNFKYILEECKNQILHVPGGYASGLKALENNSKIMICSNYTLEESKNDDFRFPSDHWNI